ncbi:SWI/SNF chromatin-remodeling complex subunit SNF5-like [Hyalella azteca]|uniref:SWI/SNF chromatin-remodeling complex subunit SNF5-like n=1 Tax=Hyalella azteca TaxID=294128 RepID=A0A979FSH8_HYAAZ|nr:SWI/SNF chromatin-remodeling complex subunit SNF5-like [Hyalella azteca]
MFLEAFVLITSTHFIFSEFPVDSFCSGEPTDSRCPAFFPAFYFNATTGFCDCYIYGGCETRGNHFDTAAECMETCGTNKVNTIDCQELGTIEIRIRLRNSSRIGEQSATDIAPQSGGQRPSSSLQPFGPAQIPSFRSQLPGAIQRPQPLLPSQGSSSASQLQDGTFSISNKPPVMNQTTVKQVHNIFNNTTTGIRPQAPNLQPGWPLLTGQVTVQQDVPRTRGQERPGLPGSADLLPPQDKEQAKPFVSASAQDFQRRQILKQQEIEMQHQASIQQHLQLQQQQQRQQHEQLLQLQEKQRQQQLAG